MTPSDIAAAVNKLPGRNTDEWEIEQQLIAMEQHGRVRLERDSTGRVINANHTMKGNLYKLAGILKRMFRRR